MDKSYFESQLGKMEELTNVAGDKQESFFQQLLIVSSTILGILVALHKPDIEFLCIRLVFVLSVLTLVLTVLSLVLLLFDLSRSSENLRQAFRKEAQHAVQEWRKLDIVTVPKKKRTLFCEKFSLIAFAVSLLLLDSYASFTAF